jgi:hypothetical protein
VSYTRFLVETWLLAALIFVLGFVTGWLFA